MTTNRPPSHVFVARRDGTDVSVLGVGVVIDPQVAIVPLSLSGPLRPCEGVVVLPFGERSALRAIPVNRVLRCEPAVGDALGLQVATCLNGPFAEPAEDEEPRSWLTNCLAGTTAWDHPQVGVEVDVTAVRMAFSIRGKARNPMRLLFPDWRK